MSIYAVFVGVVLAVDAGVGVSVVFNVVVAVIVFCEICSKCWTFDVPLFYDQSKFVLK